jgi:hypothetical protein
MKALLTLPLLAACAMDVGDETDTSSGALLGAPADPHHAFAVGFCGSSATEGPCPPRGTPGVSRCTGTLVGRNLVMTARHCVYGIDFTSADFCSNAFNETRLSETLRVTAAPSIQDADASWAAVTEVIVPATANVCDDDIAFLVLDRPLRGARPVIMDVWRDVARRPPDEIAIVGRGLVDEQYDLTTFMRVVAEDGGMTRRIAEHVPFVCASNTDDECLVEDFFSPPSNQYSMNASGFAFGAAGAGGDSGSGVYDQRLFGWGLYFVIGVANTNTIGPDGRPSGTQAVRLDRHRDTVARALRASFGAR